jgi:hypothetical protein
MPRKKQPAKHEGVFEEIAGSGIWWVRWTDEAGKRRTLSAGELHTAVTLADVPLERIAELAGHRTLSQTQRYAHLSLGKLKEALELLVPKGTTSGNQGTFQVQNSSQIGSLAKTWVLSQERKAAVSNAFQTV